MSKYFFKMILFLLLILLFQISPAMAITFIVNTQNDTGDADTADGLCRDASENCSLRAAIEQIANAGAEPLIISLPAGTYDMSAGELLIQWGEGGPESLTIKPANSDDAVIVDAGGLSRIFHINAGGQNVTLEGITIQHGVGAPGGGIYLEKGNLTLDKVVVTGNSSGASSNAGGIAHYGDQLVIRNSTLSNNTTLKDGGGLDIGGTSTANTTIENSLITGNSGVRGGGIYDKRLNSTLSIIGSTLEGNRSTAIGSAIFVDHESYDNFIGNLNIQGTSIKNNIGTSAIHSQNFDVVINGSSLTNNDGTALSATFRINESTEALKITNSTISGNGSGNSLAGGVQIYDERGLSEVNHVIANSTIADNEASSVDGVGGVRFEVIMTYSSPIELTVKNSIIANNTGTSPDCWSSRTNRKITSGGYNMIGDMTGCADTSTFGVENNDLINTNPLLAPLADNGGGRLSHNLMKDSPAFDAGNPQGCTDAGNQPLSNDQRGLTRLGRCEIGAFEVVAGDSVVSGPEACDDGNTVSGDGCQADCLNREGGWLGLSRSGRPLFPGRG